MNRSLLIAIGSVIALSGCSSLPAPAARTATAAACSPRARQTGSEACQPFVRTYSGRQLRQTGQTNPAKALQMLDPSVSVTGGP
ncbi:MAG: hypothetical protein ACYCT1_15385 [Steroidobacteraceae bacterium]